LIIDKFIKGANLDGLSKIFEENNELSHLFESINYYKALQSNED